MPTKKSVFDLDWLRVEYLASKIIPIFEFLKRKDANKSDDDMCNYVSLWKGDNRYKIDTRYAEKKARMEERAKKALEALKANKTKEDKEFMESVMNYYRANTKALLNTVKKAQETINKKEEAKKKWLDYKYQPDDVVLNIKDRIELNKEMRTVLGIPNNINTTNMRQVDEDEMNPALHIINSLWRDEIQDTEFGGNESIVEADTVDGEQSTRESD